MLTAATAGELVALVAGNPARPLDRLVWVLALGGVTVAVPGVDAAMLNPRETWADKAAYDATARKLGGQFIENFAQFEDAVDEGVREAAPKAA